MSPSVLETLNLEDRKFGIVVGSHQDNHLLLDVLGERRHPYEINFLVDEYDNKAYGLVEELNTWNAP